MYCDIPIPFFDWNSKRNKLRNGMWIHLKVKGFSKSCQHKMLKFIKKYITSENITFSIPVMYIKLQRILWNEF